MRTTIKITKRQLKRILNEALKIADRSEFEDAGGGILPEYMPVFELYVDSIHECLEYWREWGRLTYDFLQAKVKHIVLSSNSSPGYFDPNMFERAVSELVGTGKIQEFRGRWNLMQDPGSSLTKPAYVNRTLYKSIQD